jgi:hypothetical protein
MSRLDSGEHDGTYPPLPLTDCAAFRKVRTPPPREGGWQSKPGSSGALASITRRFRGPKRSMLIIPYGGG